MTEEMGTKDEAREKKLKRLERRAEEQTKEVERLQAELSEKESALGDARSRV